MFKTFSFGMVLGVALAAAALYFIPAVDQGRERSIISVVANGGNREVFHANLPADRVLAGQVGSDVSIPPGIDWPDYVNLEGSQTELFKMRNDAERVVGVASRIAAGGSRPFIEWAVHMPARGTIYVLLDSRPTESGDRAGRLRAGTREFEAMHGAVFERYVKEVEIEDAESIGRLELVTALVGPDVPYDILPDDDE